MREPINEKLFRMEMQAILNASVGCDYARAMCYSEDFYSAVKRDVEETSAWEDEGIYNDDDIRLAIGRVLMDKFGIDY